MSLRVVFMGTAELACASLKTLIASPDFAVLGVVTQPDRPKGRDLKLQPSTVKKIAVEAGLPVWQPERARHPDFIAELKGLQPDIVIVAAYGQILPTTILEAPRFGCVNLHTSLLPKYRGAAPIQWAILDGQTETGVTIMKMAAGLDTGDILSQQVVPITSEDNAATLHDRLAEVGAQLLLPTVLAYTAGQITPRPQAEAEASYARKIAKEDGRLDWTQPARLLLNRIRAFTPWPGAFTYLSESGKQRLLKLGRAAIDDPSHGSPGAILQADRTGLVVACGEGALRFQELQSEGGRKMSASEWLAGHPLPQGVKLD
jgi:methionyl-tRNA formyltransferase